MMLATKTTLSKRELIKMIKILLVLVAPLDLELVQLDVKSAFLRQDMGEEIYITGKRF